MLAFKTFSFMGNNLRIFIQDNGKIWLVGRDVCKLCGYNNNGSFHRALSEFVPDNEKITLRTLMNTESYAGLRFSKPSQPSTKLSATLVTEPGMYRIIMRSDKPEAKRFQNWVYNEVLPSIRQTGSYTLPQRSTQQLEVSEYNQDIFTDNKVSYTYEIKTVKGHICIKANFSPNTPQKNIFDLHKYINHLFDMMQ